MIGTMRLSGGVRSALAASAIAGGET